MFHFENKYYLFCENLFHTSVSISKDNRHYFIWTKFISTLSKRLHKSRNSFTLWNKKTEETIGNIHIFQEGTSTICSFLTKILQRNDIHSANMPTNDDVTMTEEESFSYLRENLLMTSAAERFRADQESFLNETIAAMQHHSLPHYQDSSHPAGRQTPTNHTGNQRRHVRRNG